jgi:hypothetical protein
LVIGVVKVTGIPDRNETAGVDAPCVCTIGLSRPLAGRLAVYATTLVFVAAGIIHVWTGPASYMLPSLSGLVIITLLGLVTYVATLLVHEGIHGLFFWIFGGRPRYGVGMITWFLPYAYATSPFDRFTLLQMSVIALAPFFWISALSLLSMSIWPAVSTYAGIAFVVNFSGAVGDLWLVRQIWRFYGCRDVRFADEKDTLAVYSSAPAAQAGAAAFAASESGTRASRFVLRWIAASGAILISAFLMIVILDVFGVRHLTIGLSHFALFTFESLPQNGPQISVDLSNLSNIVVAGLLFAALCFFFDRPKPPALDKDLPKGSSHPVVL